MIGFLQHYLLPHHSNNHRPKVLHNHILFILVLVLLNVAIGLSIFQKSDSSVLGLSADISIQDLVKLTNEQRQTKGLAPLQLNTQLSHAAETKGTNMFKENYWAHVAPDGTTPWFFIKGSGYEYLYAGENLARGYTSAPEVVEAWMASPSHRENILSPNYNDVGFAVLTGNLTGSDTVLVVEMFGTKYIADKGTDSDVAVLPSPSPTIVAALGTSPTVLPSVAPTGQFATTAVAAIQNKPLVDSKSVARNVSLFLLLLFIIVLVLDAIIVERKQIVRLVSHNLDHILFLAILLLAAIIIGKGAIL